jgi:hypothetical protein
MFEAWRALRSVDVIHITCRGAIGKKHFRLLIEMLTTANKDALEPGLLTIQPHHYTKVTAKANRRDG